MLVIIEHPHRGSSRTWVADTREDFVLALVRSDSSGAYPDYCTFEQARDIHASDFRRVEIIEGELI